MKTAVAQTADSEVNIRELVALALEKTDGTVDEATNWLVDHVRTDAQLYAALAEQALHVFAREHVGKYLSDRRRELPATMPAKVVPIDGSVFRNAVNDRYMSRPIWGGKAIGDCTAAEISASAERFDSQARTMTREAAWQAAVAKAVEANGPSEQRVRDCLSEATLSKLWEEADGDAA